MSKINYTSFGKTGDIAPLCVYEETPVSKVHFLFTMLSLYQIFVVNKGILSGFITRYEFLRHMKAGH